MTTLIQSIARWAHQTFSKEVTEESLNKLRSLAAGLTAMDVDFKGDGLEEKKGFLPAPTVHVHIHEDDDYSIGIFGVREGKKIPLHDHPGMYGIIKVIRGAVEIKTFTALASKDVPQAPKEILNKVSWFKKHRLLPTIMTGDKVITCQDDVTCLLTPTENNIHEITSIEGLSAFLDILAPPYQDGKRDCHFYAVVGTSFDSKLKLDVTWLLKTDPPTSYWCDTLPYTGPSI